MEHCWTELLGNRSSKHLWNRSKTRKRLKERFLIGRNGTKRANFRALFQATYNIKTDKQTINSTYLVSVRCSDASGRKRSTRLADVMKKRAWRLNHVSQSRVIFLPPASEHLTDTRYVELIVCIYVFLLYVAWKRGLPRKFARFVLFRPIKRRSFNLLCALDLFSERWRSALFQMLLFLLLSMLLLL